MVVILIESQRNRRDELSTLVCPDGCCQVSSIPSSRYVGVISGDDDKRRRAMKAGVFILCKRTGKILVVQSRGCLWGIPKGGSNVNEKRDECAVRELREETGVVVEKEDLGICIRIPRKNTYYYRVDLDSSAVQAGVQTDDETNDANSVGWVKPKCIKRMVDLGWMNLNNDCINLIDWIFGLRIQRRQFFKNMET